MLTRCRVQAPPKQSAGEASARSRTRNGAQKKWSSCTGLPALKIRRANGQAESWLKTKTAKVCEGSLVVPLSPARNAPVRVEDMQRDG